MQEHPYFPTWKALFSERFLWVLVILSWMYMCIHTHTHTHTHIPLPNAPQNLACAMLYLITQSCLTLRNAKLDCSPPGFSIRGILQARVLKWVAIPFSRESSQPRDWIQVSCLAGRFFTIWATREAHVYTSVYKKHALKTDKQKVTMVSKQQTRLEASCFLYHLGQKFCFVLLKQN